jgi:nucleoside-diphosphate-sugar epimerase
MLVGTPTILIINGASTLGSALVQALIQNGAKTVVVDNFNANTVRFIKRFSGIPNFTFIDRSKIESINETFRDIKYVIYLANDFNQEDNEVSSKLFLLETKFIDYVLTLALEKKSHFILVTSMHLHKDFILKRNHIRNEHVAYTESDLQNYCERIVLEYYHKVGLKARIARLATVYGPEMDLDQDIVLKSLLFDAFNNNHIRIKGDGLEYKYYIYVSDAVRGILYALFTPNVTGQIFSIANPEEISVLSLAHKILSCNVQAKSIKFIATGQESEPLYEHAYIPDPNLSEIGWKPLVPFEKGLVELIEFYRPAFTQYNKDNEQLDSWYKGNSWISDLKMNLDFNDTLNLADSIYGYEIDKKYVHRDIGRHLRQPLEMSEPPIYRNRNDVASTASVEEQSKYSPSGIVQFAIKLICIISIIAFFIIPLVRVGLIYYRLEGILDKFAMNSSNYKESILEDRFSEDFDQSLNTVRWALSMTGYEKDNQKIITGLRGIEDAIMLYNKIRQDDLYNLMNSIGYVSENEYLQLKDISQRSTEALDKIKNLDSVPLPDSLKTRINMIKSWLESNITLANAKIEARNDLY